MASWKKLIVSGGDANLANLVATTVSSSFSGSFQGDGSGLTGVVATIPSNIVSSSLQFKTITDAFTGSFTGSFVGDGSGIINVISASYAANGGGAAATYSITGSTIIKENTHNWNPAGLGTVNVIKMASSNIYALTGIMSQSSAMEIKLVNTGSKSLYITGPHPSSSAANQFITHEDLIIQPKQSISLCYDTIMQKWLPLNYSNYNTYNIVASHVTPGSVTAGDHNNLGFAVNGGANTNSTTEAYQIGPAWRLATGTGVPGTMASIYINKNNEAIGAVGTQHLTAEFVMAVDNLSTSAQEYMIELGLCNSPSTATNCILPTNQSCGIRYTHASSSGNFEGYSVGNLGSGAVISIINLNTTVVVDTAYTLRTEIDKTTYETRFYINGDLKGIIPANGTNTLQYLTAPGARAAIIKTIGSSNRFLYIGQIHSRIVIR